LLLAKKKAGQELRSETKGGVQVGVGAGKEKRKKNDRGLVLGKRGPHTSGPGW